MVATRRKREVDGSSSEEEENPKDADFTTHGVDELTFNDYFRLTRAGKVTVINKRKLYRDHLELSTLFRGWLCNFCNAKKIPLLDARTTAQYKLYQGRLYVNCTTFPAS